MKEIIRDCSWTAPEPPFVTISNVKNLLQMFPISLNPLYMWCKFFRKTLSTSKSYSIIAVIFIRCLALDQFSNVHLSCCETHWSLSMLIEAFFSVCMTSDLAPEHGYLNTIIPSFANSRESFFYIKLFYFSMPLLWLFRQV